MSKGQRLRELQEEVNKLMQEKEALEDQLKDMGQKPWTVRDYLKQK